VPVTHFLQLLHNLVLAIQSGKLPHWGSWTYFLLILLVIMEGPSATLLGAAAASAGVMKPSFVFLAATVGNLTADSLWYSVGYVGKIEWLLRFQRLGLRKQLIERLKRSMVKHTIQILLIAKFTLSFMIPTLITAGLLRIPWRRWFPTLIFADTVWTGLLITIGYYFIESIKRIQQGIKYGVLFTPIFLVIALFILSKYLKQKWNEVEMDSDDSPEES
jgi:membrane protein DedA with SNARE-associated domain